MNEPYFITDYIADSDGKFHLNKHPLGGRIIIIDNSLEIRPNIRFSISADVI